MWTVYLGSCEITVAVICVCVCVYVCLCACVHVQKGGDGKEVEE